MNRLCWMLLLMGLLYIQLYVFWALFFCYGSCRNLLHSCRRGCHLVHKIEWKFLKMKKFLVVIATMLTLASCSTVESNRANVSVQIYGRNDNINFTVVSNSVGLYQTPYGNNTMRLHIRLHWTCLIIQQNKTATAMLMSDGQKTVD